MKTDANHQDGLGRTEDFAPEWVDALVDSWHEARKPATETERQRAAADVKIRLAAFHDLVEVRPGGGIVETAVEFADAIRSIPLDEKVRFRVLMAAIVRVKLRRDVSSTEKLVFEYVAKACATSARHCYRLRSQIGTAIGIERDETITAAVVRLATKGLIFLKRGHAKDGDRTAGRMFIVPALVPVDFEREKAQDGKRHCRAASELVAISRLQTKAGIGFPYVEAQKLAEGSEARSSDDIENRPPPPPHAVSGGGDPTPHAVSGGGNRDQTFGSDFKAAGSACEEPHAPSPHGFSGQGEGLVDGDLDEKSISEFGADGALTKKQARIAFHESRYLTYPEIATNFRQYRLGGREATFRGFLNGLPTADERKRKQCQRKLRTEAAIAAFATWDRNINNSSKKPLAERLDEFLASPGGSALVLKAKIVAKRFKDAAGEDRAFEIDRNFLVFDTGSGNAQVRMDDFLQRVTVGSADEIFAATDWVIQCWQHRGVKPSADVATALADEVIEHIKSLHGSNLF